MKTLTIKLTAPLQSYGNEAASFNRRTTYPYPSKSAVLGMIGAALGYRRNDPRLATLNQLGFAVRIDQIGQPLTDFQIIHINNAQGNTIGYRYYLEDAIYVAAIYGPDAVIQKIAHALHHPKFQLSLGRRSNPPAGSLQTKIHSADPIAVLSALPWQASDWYQRKLSLQKVFNAAIISDYQLSHADYLPKEYAKDLIGSFSSQHRWHKTRPIVKLSVDLLNPYYDPNSDDFYAAI